MIINVVKIPESLKYNIYFSISYYVKVLFFNKIDFLFHLYFVSCVVHMFCTYYIYMQLTYNIIDKKHAT